jgi:hypothetical protein
MVGYIGKTNLGGQKFLRHKCDHQIVDDRQDESHKEYQKNANPRQPSQYTLKLVGLVHGE